MRSETVGNGRKLSAEFPSLPVKDQLMPPYRFQEPTHGGGWATSDGRSGMWKSGERMIR